MGSAPKIGVFKKSDPPSNIDWDMSLGRLLWSTKSRKGVIINSSGGMNMPVENNRLGSTLHRYYPVGKWNRAELVRVFFP